MGSNRFSENLIENLPGWTYKSPLLGAEPLVAQNRFTSRSAVYLCAIGMGLSLLVQIIPRFFLGEFVLKFPILFFLTFYHQMLRLMNSETFLDHRFYTDDSSLALIRKGPFSRHHFYFFQNILPPNLNTQDQVKPFLSPRDGLLRSDAEDERVGTWKNMQCSSTVRAPYSFEYVIGVLFGWECMLLFLNMLENLPYFLSLRSWGLWNLILLGFIAYTMVSFYFAPQRRLVWSGITEYSATNYQLSTFTLNGFSMSEESKFNFKAWTQFLQHLWQTPEGKTRLKRNLLLFVLPMMLGILWLVLYYTKTLLYLLFILY